jgi:hypothetical protein
MRLVDGLDEQALLEQLLEQSKPPLPAGTGSLHYLLATPFRYPPRYPGGSRFRAATEPGVFYGADEQRTACAELGYWRWRFLMDAPALARLTPLAHTLFRCDVAGNAVDLMSVPFARDADRWSSRNDYSHCQQLGGAARAAGVELIRYRSVRDPQGGACTAVLAPAAFTSKPRDEQSWLLTVTRTRVAWQRDSALHSEGFEFAADWG